MEQKEENNISLNIPRNTLILILLPVVFLLGLGLGYVLWESPEDPAVAQEAVTIDEGASSDVSSALEAEVQAPSVAEQIESLPRHQVSLDDLDPFNGPADAPIVIVEFSDFECPFCQRHFQEVYPQLQSSYPDQIKYYFLDFPLTSIHPNAVPAAEASLCALEQDAFWPFHDLLFGGSLNLGRASYESYASSLGLDIDAFTVCLDDGRYNEEVMADLQQGVEIGVSSTPTFFINGIGLVGAQPFEVFAQIIDYELERVEGEAN